MIDYRLRSIDSLHRIASRMNVLSAIGDDGYSFDMITASIIWSDELPAHHLISTAHHWGLRPVFGYRGSLNLGKPDPTLEEYWHLAKQLFPNWVGFLPERSAHNVELAAFIEREIAQRMAELAES